MFRHTLLVSGNPRAVSGTCFCLSRCECAKALGVPDAALHELTFVPAEHRQSPSQLELLLRLAFFSFSVSPLRKCGAPLMLIIRLQLTSRIYDFKYGYLSQL